jgi:hypothetical protein
VSTSGHAPSRRLVALPQVVASLDDLSSNASGRWRVLGAQSQRLANSGKLNDDAGTRTLVTEGSPDPSRAVPRRMNDRADGCRHRSPLSLYQPVRVASRKEGQNSHTWSCSTSGLSPLRGPGGVPCATHTVLRPGAQLLRRLGELPHGWSLLLGRGVRAPFVRCRATTTRVDSGTADSPPMAPIFVAMAVHRFLTIHPHVSDPALVTMHV